MSICYQLNEYCIVLYCTLTKQLMCCPRNATAWQMRIFLGDVKTGHARLQERSSWQFGLI